MRLLPLLCLCAWHVASVLSMETLYDWDEPIAQLHASNFSDIIWHSETAWVVVFYLTWCGHCKRYAPIYTEFARQVEGWNAVARVAAVACDYAENSDLCRDYGLYGYPTLKFFPPRCIEREIGETYEGRRYPIFLLRHATLDYVQSVDLEEMWNPPDAWPQLEPFESLTDLRDEFIDQATYTLAIVEGPGSDPYLGKELIAELMNAPELAAGRIIHHDNVTLFVEEETEDGTVLSELPLTNDVGVFLIANNSYDEEPILTTIPAAIADNVTSRVFHERGNITVHAESKPHYNDTTTEATITESPESVESNESAEMEEGVESDEYIEEEVGWQPDVHMQDLESALYYLMYFEVGSKQYLHTPHLKTLQDIMNILCAYFPGRDHVMRFLNQVNHEFQLHDPELTMEGEEWVAWITRCNGQDGYLPQQVVWAGCEGSEPQYRGFPCGLWTLFHELTVNAYISNENNTSFEPEEILLPIRAFVRYYFSCRECARHFMMGTRNFEEILQTPEDTILWLWRKHNSANFRLQDDITEDPEHPKVIFPTEDMCPSCRRDNYTVCNETSCHPQDDLFWEWSLWDLDEVLDFLIEMYRPENLIMDDNITETGYTAARRRKRQACRPHPQETDWSPCSVTCGVGTQTRRTNLYLGELKQCKLTTETQLCKLRDCGMAVVPAGDECEPTVFTTQPTAFTYEHCSTSMHNQWRYCNRCAGKVCRPEQTIGFEMLFECGTYERLFDVGWIISCSCDAA